MKQNVILTIASLLSILFMTLHLTSDTIHAKVGTAEAGGSTLVAVPILVVWLYGTLVLAERRSGYIIMLVGSLLGVGHACHPRDGSGRRFSRRDRQVQPSLLVHLDASRARQDWDVLPHPLGARTLEPATGPAPVVQQLRTWKGPSHGGGDRRESVLPINERMIADALIEAGLVTGSRHLVRKSSTDEMRVY
jgi:hypothetical protein